MFNSALESIVRKSDERPKVIEIDHVLSLTLKAKSQVQVICKYEAATTTEIAQCGVGQAQSLPSIKIYDRRCPTVAFRR
jgi:hypothetical protein